MSSFKKMMKDDLDSVFLNLEEFSDEHLLNGNPYHVLLDEEELNKFNSSGYQGKETIYQADILFYLKEDDMPAVRVGDVISFDGKERFVYSTKVIEGLRQIVLGRKKV